jgi:hypothetical protein
MSVVSLPARIGYTAVAMPIGAVAGFYSCMRLLPEYTAIYPQIDPGRDGSGIFRIAICAGAVIAFTASLLALTMPWLRHRKRRGRPSRIVISCVVVSLASIQFADQGFKLVYDLVFAAWLTYTLAFTFVRYGVVDRARRSTASANEAS